MTYIYQCKDCGYSTVDIEDLHYSRRDEDKRVCGCPECGIIGRIRILKG